MNPVIEILKEGATHHIRALSPAGELTAHIEFIETECEIDIVDLSTVPAYRRRGIMVDLMAKLMKMQKQVHLEVRHTNFSAISLYLRLGFEFSGFRRGYYRNGEHALQFRYQSIVA